MKSTNRWRFVLVGAAVALAVGAYLGAPSTQAQGPTRFPGAISSQPLALSADGGTLAVANPDNKSVTIFNVENDRNIKVGEVYAGQEPNGVALTPDGRRLFVANTVSGTVSVSSVDRNGAQAGRFVANIVVGTEPYALAMAPNGTKLYVANARSNNISVIDVYANRVVRTIDVGPEPRGLAMTNDGDDDDDDETLLVTQFLALPVATGKLDGEDDSKVALVTSIETGSGAVNGTIVLRPLADSGFLAAGDAIARQAPPAAPVAADFRFRTGAYPNQLNSIVIKDRFAFVPSTGASPNGPTRFNVNTQSLLHVLDFGARTDANQTINMHRAIATQANADKLFPTQPWAIAHKYRGNEAFVVSAASDFVLKLNVNPANGAATVANHPTDATRALRIPVGRNPRGIVINGADTRAYVMNYVGRDVSIIDLRASPERVIGAMLSAPLPERGGNEDILHVGKELYYSSVGTFDAATANGPTITGRMSSEGWGSCSSCHPFGLSDNVVWIFGAGPRRTVSQHLDFDIFDPGTQKLLNWSGIFDEEEDFELNIRGVSGGLGLIVGADGVTPETTVTAFAPPNAGRRQLKVRGINAWDAIKAYIQFGIRPPISPVDKNDPDVVAGEQLFRQANCQSCHGGPLWTSGLKQHAGQPDAALISNAQIVGALKKVGTFDASLRTEVRATGVAPLGADGYVPGSLLSLFAFPRTFFHNGSADSLDAVMNNVEHRAAGTGVDLLDDAEQRRKLIRFILSIDAATQPIYP